MIAIYKRKPYIETLEISDGTFPNERFVSVLDWEDEIHYGFFDQNMIRNDMLEVVVIEEDNDLACVKPARGQEFNLSGDAITVREDQITYQ